MDDVGERVCAENGKVDVAESLFWKMPEKNKVSWTVMFIGFIQDGRIDDARKLYCKD